MCWVLSSAGGRCACSMIVVALLAFGFVFAPTLRAQGAVNDIGNGGRHAIQGRLYVANGQRSQVSGLTIRLTNSSAGDISLITDETGTFMFRNLNAGSYSVAIDGRGVFENASESVVIDDPGSSNIRTGIRLPAAPRIVNMQIYLRPLAARKTDPPRAINAKWAGVPKNAIEHYDRGVKLVREGKDSQAEVEFRQSISVTPSFAPAHTELGRVAQRAGNLNEAIEEWKQAVRYDPSDFDAHLNLGIAFLNLKNYKEAETALVNAAFLDRSAVSPHYYLGILFVMKNDLDVARKAFETARDLEGGKGLPAIHKYLGRIYKTKQMNKEAVQEFETYLSLSPTAQDAAKVRQDISDIKNIQNQK